MKKRYILLFFIVLFGIVAFILVTSTPTQAPMTIVPSGTTQQNTTQYPEPVPTTQNEHIIVTSPAEGSRITSPLTLTGSSAGWYFEGSFPVELTDDQGNIIAQKYVTAQGNWMTADFVPFKGTLEFTVPTGVTRGYLIFKKDNPSGEARFDEEFLVPVTF